jgi:hypothetical protein
VSSLTQWDICFPYSFDKQVKTTAGISSFAAGGMYLPLLFHRNEKQRQRLSMSISWPSLEGD